MAKRAGRVALPECERQVERAVRVEQVELPAGLVDFEDSQGSGPIVVMFGGLSMTTSLWRGVVADLKPDHRCIAVTLPLGGHRVPMKPDADLSLQGLANLEADFLEALDLEHVTLVGNDSGAFIRAAADRPERMARLVITSCEAFENYPPGIAGHLLCYAAKLPGGLNALFQPLRVRPFRRLPFAFGAMSNRPIPDEVMDAWLEPLLTQRAIRRDLEKYLRSCTKGEMLAACEELTDFDRPVLVAWGADDRMMPIAHGRRFAKTLPNARIVEIEDSSTLVSEDQPQVLARHIKEFIAATS